MELFGVKSISIQGREDIPRGVLVLQTQIGEVSWLRKRLI